MVLCISSLPCLIQPFWYFLIEVWKVFFDYQVLGLKKFGWRRLRSIVNVMCWYYSAHHVFPFTNGTLQFWTMLNRSSPVVCHRPLISAYALIWLWAGNGWMEMDGKKDWSGDMPWRVRVSHVNFCYVFCLEIGKELWQFRHYWDQHGPLISSLQQLDCLKYVYTQHDQTPRKCNICLMNSLHLLYR